MLTAFVLCLPGTKAIVSRQELVQLIHISTYADTKCGCEIKQGACGLG